MSPLSLLHEPPTNHGINRTSWTMPLLSQVLKKNDRQIGPALISRMIKAAGYKWRKAKTVLTSNDPTYTEKLARIRSILSNLQFDEAFFSIDEYGPFAIKTKPGRTLVPPGIQPTVPQWHKSRGCIIVTAALDLSGNQVTHFYSVKKNTGEMLHMMDVLPRMLDQVLAPLVRGTGHGECLYGVVSPSERELFRTWAQALAPDHSGKRPRDRTTHS